MDPSRDPCPGLREDSDSLLLIRFSKAWSLIKIFCSESESGACCLTPCGWGGDGPAAAAGISPHGGGGGGPAGGGGGPAGGDGGLAGGGGAPALAGGGNASDGEPPPRRHSKNHSHLPQQPATMDTAAVKMRSTGTANIIVISILKGVARINPLFYTNSLRNLRKLY